MSNKINIEKINKNNIKVRNLHEKNGQIDGFVRNPSKNNRTYALNQKKIEKVLNVSIENGARGVRIVDICRETCLSRQTVYLHGKNVDELFRRYEIKIVEEFCEKRTYGPNKGLFFTLLLGYLKNKKEYFLAAAGRRNFYVLVGILEKWREFLVGARVGDCGYFMYLGQVVALVMTWMLKEEFSAEKIDAYVQKIMRVRPIVY